MDGRQSAWEKVWKIVSCGTILDDAQDVLLRLETRAQHVPFSTRERPRRLKSV